MTDTVTSPQPSTIQPPSLTAVQRLGETLFRYRDYTPIPIVILSLLFAEPSIISLVGGLLVALFGEAVRTYGVAFIGTISRTRSYSNGSLVQDGPFSLLRNPLYLGNLILSVGLALMSGVAWLPLLVIVFFYAQYIPIVAWEEMKLSRIFGQAYSDYCTKVPNRWFPRLSTFASGSWYLAPDTWAPALKSEKRTLTSVLSYMTLMAVLYAFHVSQNESLLPLVKKLLP